MLSAMFDWTSREVSRPGNDAVLVHLVAHSVSDPLQHSKEEHSKAVSQGSWSGNNLRVNLSRSSLEQ